MVGFAIDACTAASLFLRSKMLLELDVSVTFVTGLKDVGAGVVLDLSLRPCNDNAAGLYTVSTSKVSN